MDNTPVGVTLRKIRKTKGVTLVELQLRSGVNRELIRRYETGKAIPPGVALLKLLKSLGVNEQSTEGQGIITAVIAERHDSLLRGYVLPHSAPTARKLQKLVDEYFTLSGQERTPEIEFTVTRRFDQILNEQ